MFFFVCSATLFYLQHSSFLFPAFLFFICSVPFFIFAAVPFFVCSVSFLVAEFLFCLQRSFFVYSVSFLFAAFLFCLQRFFFSCSVPFLFAAFLFCLQRFFFVCSMSLVGHRICALLFAFALFGHSDLSPLRVSMGWWLLKFWLFYG